MIAYAQRTVDARWFQRLIVATILLAGVLAGIETDAAIMARHGPILVGALIKSFSSMGYVSLLLGLMFYIYAVMGVHLFGGHAAENSGTLPLALLALFQMITLDDWRDLYASVQGSSPAAAAAYFVSFILLGTMIMLNLFIGIIMNSMSEMHSELDEQVRAKQSLAEKNSVLSDITALDQQLSILKSQTQRLPRETHERHLLKVPELRHVGMPKKIQRSMGFRLKRWRSWRCWPPWC